MKWATDSNIRNSAIFGAVDELSLRVNGAGFFYSRSHTEVLFACAVIKLPRLKAALCLWL